jgi:hypothetical protein
MRVRHSCHQIMTTKAGACERSKSAWPFRQIRCSKNGRASEPSYRSLDSLVGRARWGCLISSSRVQECSRVHFFHQAGDDDGPHRTCGSGLTFTR